MKLGLYWKYASRSLGRGGQRTLLAIFCVAVGVLAIVALQLVGNMINASLTGNVREGNSGDLSIRSDVEPVLPTQLSFFDQLKQSGQITAYTAISEHQAQSPGPTTTQYYELRAIDPNSFPLVGAPVFQTPARANLRTLLGGTDVVVTSNLLTQLGARVGDLVRVTSDDGRAFDARITGVIAGEGFYRRPEMLISLDGYRALPSTSGKPVDYQAVYVTVPGASDANASAVEKRVQQEFPLATLTTTQQALQQEQDNIQQIRYFLQVVGLLALLIGGVGIVNTMQVLLRRRRVEIAMLKTTGYRQRDLLWLFGLEAALLGALGGALGAAAGVAVSYGISALVERAFFIHLTFAVDPFTVGSGVIIGICTALIFGLLPIVQASQVRPQAVLREAPEGNQLGSHLLSGALLLVLAALFFVLARAILGNTRVALYVVGGTAIFLGVLAVVFTLVVVVVSRLPVLEHFTWWYALLLLAALAGSGVLAYYYPVFGTLALAVSALGVVVVLLPRAWKANIKMALRNIGRARARTVTTLVALFVGVFAIGLVLVLGQNIRTKIDEAFSTVVQYNAFILAGTADKSAVEQQLAHMDGLQQVAASSGCPAQRYKVNAIAQGVPLAVNGTPVAQLLQGAGSAGPSNLGRSGALRFLSAIEGWNLSAGPLPQCDNLQLASTNADGAPIGGRMLTAADASTSNVVVAKTATLAPLHLKVGDTITLLSADHRTQVALHIVGFWDDTGKVEFGSIFASNQTVNALTAGQPTYIYSLQEDPAKADQALQQVQRAIPSVQTFSLVDLTLFIDTLLNNLIIMLIAVASLAMLAGVIIIANAVALAMLERRRELGILKSVGHTSGSVLGEVLMENGAVGFTGALIAMALVAVATTVLGSLVFKTDFGVGGPVVLVVILATAAVCMVVAGLVAWGATRVRPLEVLRYE